MDNNCAYCMEGELVAKFGIKICELNASKVYLALRIKNTVLYDYYFKRFYKTK